MSTDVYSRYLQPHSETEAFAAISDDLSAKGFAIMENFITNEWVAELREEQQQQRGFREAGIGRNHLHRLDSLTRSDQILWLDNNTAMSAQRQYLNVLEELRLTINRDLQLGLYEVETLAALYRPGSFYKRHLDSFRRANRRTLTTILYLNDRWHPNDGGMLPALSYDRSSRPVY